MFNLFYKRLGEDNKKNFHSVEIRNFILIYTNIKRVFFDFLIKSFVYLLAFLQNSMMFEGSLNSLTESYFTEELRQGES